MTSPISALHWRQNGETSFLYLFGYIFLALSQISYHISSVMSNTKLPLPDPFNPRTSMGATLQGNIKVVLLSFYWQVCRLNKTLGFCPFLELCLEGQSKPQSVGLTQFRLLSDQLVHVCGLVGTNVTQQHSDNWQLVVRNLFLPSVRRSVAFRSITNISWCSRLSDHGDPCWF